MYKAKLIILRGLPGSGKSTLARKLAQEYDAYICSTDRYFEDPVTGKYTFNVSKLAEYHGYNQYKVRQLLTHNENVVVDNTNVSLRDLDIYLNIGEVTGADIEIYTLKWEPEQLKIFADRNVHGVPFEKILQMAQRWSLTPKEYKNREHVLSCSFESKEEIVNEQLLKY